MKKFLIFPILAIVLVCASCSSDDNDSDSSKLAGSSWSGEEDRYDKKIFTNIEFQSTTFSLSSKIIYSDNSGHTEAFTGTYEYNPPRLTLRKIVNGENQRGIEFVVFKDKIVNEDYGTLLKE